MNKKLIITLLIVFMLIVTIPTNVISIKNSNGFNLSSSKSNINDKEKNNSNSENSFYELLRGSSDYKSKIIRSTDFLRINSTMHWIKVNSSGKGFHLIIPVRLLKLNLPIPTIQYYNFFPFKIDMFITLIVYNDSRANTTIERQNREPIYINGSHSLLLGMIKIPSINLLRQLLSGGIIDGIQPIQQLFGKVGLQKYTFAGFLRRVRDYIIDEPIIDISNKTRYPDLVELFKTLSGIPPRYKGGPILNFSYVNYTWHLIEEIFPSFRGLILYYIIKDIIRYDFVLIPGFIWNRSPIRTSFFHFEMPQQLLGFTPFVLYSKPPPRFLHRFVQGIQLLIPNIFHEKIEFVKFN